jgi:HNH endonuclease
MSDYAELCAAMHARGWLSHPLAAMQLGWPHRGKSLGRALRSTRTYQAYESGQSPPSFREESATPATLTYRDRNGVIVDRVFLDRATGLMMHVHSINGDRTIAFLDDVPPHHIAVPADKTTVRSPEPGDDSSDVLTEGQQSSLMLTVYERNPVARQRCIDHYGTSCSVCGFSFGEMYGQSFADRIHVHHLTPLSERETEYEVDPVRDLRPVCPNCHVVIHSKHPPLTVDQLKQMVRAAERKT